MSDVLHEQERPRREQISTRVAVDALAAIEKAAEQQRTTASHIACILLEDGARQLAGRAA